ncbi:uncharacterized protein LOC122459443 [Dermochelys coriacea]|uniref:uncharacterized protein LOC122459443 n=1 Tax=Dermochelys coriacea TaxID=27794 RepID=UPI001CA82AEE|nr:uncharacterized protein LOC122459443 [Dermochelys coriacea]
MTPALEPELETHLLRAALHVIFTLGTEKDTTQVQDLYRVLPDLLDAMLGNLLAESPDTSRLHYILENSAEFPRMGHHWHSWLCSFGDPAKDISRQAREGVYRLYQLLLHQRRLTIHEAEDLWCWDWHQDSRLLGYKNTAKVGEVFGKFFLEGQRRSFLQTAVLAIHDPLLRVSQAGLLLTYSLLGEAQQLMGTRKAAALDAGDWGRTQASFAGLAQEDVTANVMHQLRSIRHLCQMPEALQGLCL